MIFTVRNVWFRVVVVCRSLCVCIHRTKEGEREKIPPPPTTRRTTFKFHLSECYCIENWNFCLETNIQTAKKAAYFIISDLRLLRGWFIVNVGDLILIRVTAAAIAELPHAESRSGFPEAAEANHLRRNTFFPPKTKEIPLLLIDFVSLSPSLSHSLTTTAEAAPICPFKSARKNLEKTVETFQTKPILWWYRGIRNTHNCCSGAGRPA